VIGLGRLGYVHAQNLARNVKHAQLTAVCDVDEELSANAGREFGCKSYTDIEKLVADPDVDAVCVVTPTDRHVQPVTLVVESGKPLFCEKPLAGTLDDTVALADLIKAGGKPFQIGFMRRFDPPCARAKTLIQEGAIGRPVYFCGFSRDPFPPPPWACNPATGGGLFIDMLIHDFDLARFLMGDAIVEVFARDANLLVDSQGIERFADNATVSMKFKNGGLGHSHASMHAGYGYDMRSEVFGTEGNLSLGGLNKTELTLSTPGCGISKPETFLTVGKMPHFMYRFADAYRNQLEAFVTCLLDGKMPSVNEDDALAAYRVALAATESAANHTAVSLS
jgi:scyllo-inositol 2-dehydrogenase (NAD+)